MFKNCPCYDKDYEECLNTPRDVYIKCLDINDCLLKQIVEKCKKAQLPILQWENKDSIWTEYSPKSELAKEILDLFEIEEIEVFEDD